MISEAGGGDVISGDRVVTRTELFDLAGRATAGFASLGIGPGDAIALMLRNDFPFLAASFGVGRLGGHAVPINWHFQADEARHILDDSGAKAVVVHTDLLPQITEAIPDDLPLLLVDTPPELIEAYRLDTEALAAGVDRRHGLDWDDWVQSFESWTGEVYVESTINSEFTYHGRADERVDIEHEGLITLGDVGHLDEDRYLYLSDRKKDMIISGGVNIYPAEIEAALIAIQRVADCAVFGISHDEFGEVPHAVVQVRDGYSADAEAIRAELTESLAKYKVPRTIDFLEDLPREETGKIYKRRLRDPYWIGHDSNI